ncbi:MAG TPA: DUF3419 family protein [Ignavibacteria bacterium]|nr:DUF3419 family protein [Ignavibacteria bacterium]HMR41498.1 DUF3419 family protein [Ignavibacteria bacterium]
MKLTSKIRKFEFESRIFISLSIVILACIISVAFFSHYPPVYITLFRLSGLEEYSSLMFLFASVFMIFISLLRMWAGSLLTSNTVMSFKVRSESLVTSGVYLLVRNPIYFSDWLALTLCSLFLPVSGLLIPLLFYLHYIELIKYEEESFSEVQEGYSKYVKEVPRLIPTLNSTIGFLKSKPHLYLNKDGIRHNALFILFVPGFLVGYFTESFLLAVLIGIPAVLDWAIVHTRIGLPKSSSKQIHKQKQSKVFSNVLYSQCWEDPQIDREAFNIREDDVVFSITSGGCNLLAFLIDDPASVIALDLNPHQNHLLELKIAAFRSLSYYSLLEFIGVRKCNKRRELYDMMKISLSKDAKIYWDNNPEQIEHGIIHCGRYENYMKMLGNCVRFLTGSKTIRKFFETENMNERKKLFDTDWNSRRWKIFTKVFLSRRIMSLLFDKAFFKYLKKEFSFGDHFSEKTKRALTQLPVRQNYFLRYILFGNFDESFLPPYLRKENFDIIKSRLRRIKIVTDSCENYFRQLPDESISKFNFTNIFEWIPEDAFENVLIETIRVAKDNAVITYRNLLVPREHPESLSGIIESDKLLAKQLHNKDLSFIYDNYIVEKIRKGNEKWDIKLSEYQQEIN